MDEELILNWTSPIRQKKKNIPYKDHSDQGLQILVLASTWTFPSFSF